jgi:hypothetical protein
VGERQRFYEAYEAESGRRINDAAVRAYEVLAHCRWAVIALQQGERHASGREPLLDHALTGKIAEELDRLYKYVGWRLTVANLRNDQEILQECFDLLSTVHESWCAIRGTVGSGRLQ